MMLSDVCRVHPGGMCGPPAGRRVMVDRVRLGLAQGCRCALPLQAWTGAYRGGRQAQGLGVGDEHPPTLFCGAWLTLAYVTLPIIIF